MVSKIKHIQHELLSYTSSKLHKPILVSTFFIGWLPEYISHSLYQKRSSLFSCTFEWMTHSGCDVATLAWLTHILDGSILPELYAQCLLGQLDLGKLFSLNRRKNALTLNWQFFQNMITPLHSCFCRYVCSEIAIYTQCWCVSDLWWQKTLSSLYNLLCCFTKLTWCESLCLVNVPL